MGEEVKETIKLIGGKRVNKNEKKNLISSDLNKYLYIY